MIYLIEQIGMKPTGFLASWRYVNVFFNDQTGAITTAAVPGKEFPNLPCLSDYRKNNRPNYSLDSNSLPLVKETCNFTTHTNYRLYAQDCTPYIYVQTDVNATKCGYNTVLPTPGLPTLPFPTPPYGLYKYIEFCQADDLPEAITVNFYKKNYSGAVTEITKGAGDPVRFNIDNNDENEFGIRATEAEISLTVDENFSLSEFYTFDEAEFKVEILLGTDAKFYGFVIPDSCAEPFKEQPYNVTIRATDCLGGLENVNYQLPPGTVATLRQTRKDVLAYCLYMTRLNLDIVTSVNLYEIKMTTTLDDDPLALSSINPAVFGDQKGQMMSCYEILNELCKADRCILKQENGKWVYQRTCELVYPTNRRRIYNYTGLFLRSELSSPLRTIGKNQAVTLDSGAEISIGNAYKRVEVLLDYGNVPSMLLNGDFETWDGFNFQFWSKFGGINISRVERGVQGSQGIVGLNNFACQFNQKVDQTKYIQHDTISVIKGDKISFKILVGPKNLAFPCVLRIRFQIGSYCLYNDPDPYAPRTYTWENQLATTSLVLDRVNNPQFVTVSMPEAPVSGEFTVQIYGFDYPDERQSFFWIDNAGISKSNSDQGDYEITGSLAISEQLNFYTNKPKLLEIKIGDYEDPGLIAPTIPPIAGTDKNVQNNIYAIYTKGGAYSQLWSEYGISGNGVSFNLANAKAGLRIARSPYVFMRNSVLRGDDLSFFDVYSIIVPGSAFENKRFIVVSGSYSLKYKKFEGTLRELITGQTVTNDVVSPFLPKQFMVASIQDENSVPNLGDINIFTEQFTQEFD